MIREIIMKNIKGQVTNQPLSGRDIICGTNGMGKTTRAQAIGISLLGYVPGKGKLASETYKLCSNGTMTVGLKTDDFEFMRSFTKKSGLKNGLKEVSVTQKITVSPDLGDTKKEQKEARILAHVGNLPVMLDFNEFLSLSAAKRREFFYNLAKINTDEWSKNGIHKKLIQELLTAELEENNLEMFTVLDSSISAVINKYADEDIQLGIQKMLDYAKARLSHWKEEKTKADGAAQKISEYKNDLQVTDRNLEKHKTALEDLQAERITVSSTIAVSEEKQKVRSEQRARIEALGSEMNDIRNETPPSSEENILKEIKDCEANIQEVDNSKKIKSGRESISDLRADIEENEACIKQCNADISKAKSDAAAYQKLLDMIRQNQGHCVIDQRIKCEKKFDKFIELANTEIDTANQFVSDIEAAIKIAEQAVTKSKDSIAATELEINRLIDAERSVNKNNENIRTKVSQLQNTLNTIRSFDAAKAEKIKVRQEELDRLTAALGDDTEPQDGDISTEIAKKAAIEAQILELKKLIDDQNKTRIRLLDFKNSVIDGETAEYNVECWKLISRALGPSGIQGQIVKGILEPLKNTIQEKLDAMGVDKDFFFETSSDSGKEVFQFGWCSNPEEKHNFDALSNGEQMLLLIALITTIIERNNPPLKILMIDNIENLDQENFKKVMAGMDIIAQGLDNVIFLGVVDPNPADCPGWVVWNLNHDTKEMAL